MRKPKELKGYVLYKAKDMKSRNESRLLGEDKNNLLGLLVVRSVRSSSCRAGKESPLLS